MIIRALAPRTALAAGLLLCLAGCARPRAANTPSAAESASSSSTAAQAALDWRASRPGDSLAMTINGDQAEIVVTSPSGIGRATLAPRASWPRSVRLIFQHEPGQPFRSLESLAITTPRLQVSGSVNTSGRAEFAFVDPSGAAPPQATPAGFLDLRITVTAQLAEAVLPDYLLAGAETVQIEWVDFWR
jgi:hypothetical protein